MTTYSTNIYRVTYKDGRTEDVHLREAFVIDGPGIIRRFTGALGDNALYEHPHPATISKIVHLPYGTTYPREGSR
jgi:hypothetical protein